jgi:hypothetical protein
VVDGSGAAGVKQAVRLKEIVSMPRNDQLSIRFTALILVERRQTGGLVGKEQM